MLCKLKKDMVGKKKTIPKGTEVSVSVGRDTPWNAIITADMTIMMMKSDRLYKYFNEFIQITEDRLADAVCDGECLSLTGVSVEPDGWDSKGFPSIMLVDTFI